MTTEHGEPQAKQRTAAEIEADLLRTRAELTRSVDELTDRLDPRRQVEDLKVQAKQLATGAGEQAKTFVEDVKARDPKALRVVGGVAAAVAALVGIAAIRRGR